MDAEAITMEFFRQQAISVERGRVKAYFDSRPKFCVSFCPLYRELSDTCPVVDGDMEPPRCPDSANLKEHVWHATTSTT